MKVTKDTILKNILELKDGEKILKKHKVPCLSCAFAAMELGKLSIGDVSNIYGLDLDNILIDLNNS